MCPAGTRKFHDEHTSDLVREMIQELDDFAALAMSQHLNFLCCAVHGECDLHGDFFPRPEFMRAK